MLKVHSRLEVKFSMQQKHLGAWCRQNGSQSQKFGIAVAGSFEAGFVAALARERC